MTIKPQCPSFWQNPLESHSLNDSLRKQNNYISNTEKKFQKKNNNKCNSRNSLSIPIHSIHFISSSSTWHSWRCNDVTFLERFPVILVQYLKHAFHCKIQQMWGEFLLHRYTDVWSSYTNYFTKSSSVLCASLLADVARAMQKPIKPNNTNVKFYWQ